MEDEEVAFQPFGMVDSGTFVNLHIFEQNQKMMQPIQLPLNEVQVSLLKLTEGLSENELLELKKLLIAYKAERLAKLTDRVWDEKGWTQETMNQFLRSHLRKPSSKKH